MDKQRILRILDGLDDFMINNLGKDNKFINPNDYSIIENSRAIEYLDREAQNSNLPDLIRSRIKLTKAAYESARTNEKVDKKDMSSYYYNYINSMKLILNDKFIDPYHVLQYIAIAVHSYHQPDDSLFDYLRHHSEDLTESEKEYYGKMLVPLITEINKTIYSEELSLTVQDEKTSFFNKIRSRIKSLLHLHSDLQQYDKARESNVQEERPLETEFLDAYRQSSFRDRVQTKVEPEQIVIGDLHGNLEKWQRVEEYLKNNPTAKVYVLGDATDRGPDGLKILRRIKELSDHGRVVYIPGNHDINVYKYLRFDKDQMFSSIMSKQLFKYEIDVLSKIYSHKTIDSNDRFVLGDMINSKRFTNLEKTFLNAYGEMAINYGYVTMEALDQYRQNEMEMLHNGQISNYITEQEFRDWLGNLPIQRNVKVGNNIYLLAHAVPIGGGNNSYNIAMATNDEINGDTNNDEYCKYYTTMWYRQNRPETIRVKPDFPIDYIGVVGHTSNENVVTFAIGDSPNKLVHCIDCSRTQKLPAWNLNRNIEIELLPVQQKTQNPQKYLQNH